MSNASILDAMTSHAIARFDAKVDASGVCHEWRAGTSAGGYGLFRLGGRMVTTHKVAWTRHNGLIPEGLCVLHECDNRLCVNPAHLSLGTQAENMADMVAKGRSRRGARHHAAKLTTEQAAEVRARYAHGGVTQRALAAEYGMSQGAISELINHKSWK